MSTHCDLYGMTCVSAFGHSTFVYISIFALKLYAFSFTYMYACCSVNDIMCIFIHSFVVLQFFDYQYEVTSYGGRFVMNLSMYSTD